MPTSHPSRSTTPSRGHDEMIAIAQPSHFSGTGKPSLRTKMTRSQNSSKYATPSSSTLVSGMSSPASTSSALVFDNFGQAHDPDYTNALREQLAIIGENASAAKRGAAVRRLSPGRSGSNAAYDRPSTLGLGLSSNFARLDLRRADGSDMGGDDASSDEDDDDAQTLSTRTRSNTQATSVASQESSSSKYRQSSDLSMTAAQRSPILDSHHLMPATASGSKSGVRRHLSFTTDTNTDAHENRAEHRGLFGRRGSASPSRSTKPAFLSPTSGRYSSGGSASTGHASQHSSAHQTRRRSPLSSPSNSRPTTAEKDKHANDNDWGFTGIVDVERLRNAREATAAAQGQSSLFDEDEGNSPDLAKTAANGYRHASAGNLSELVQAASLNRSSRAASTSAVGANLPRKPSLLRKGSSDELPGSGRSGRTPSMRQRLHGGRSSTSSRLSSGSSDQQGGIPAFGAKAGTSSIANALEARAPPAYRHVDGERTMLSTIPSGKTITNNSGEISTLRMSSPILGDSSARRSLALSDVALASPMAEAASPDEADTANVGDASASTADDSEAGFSYAASTPSRVFSSGGKADDENSGSSASHELRRKVEVFAMGVRFNAFKAKRKLARGMTSSSKKNGDA